MAVQRLHTSNLGFTAAAETDRKLVDRLNPLLPAEERIPTSNNGLTARGLSGGLIAGKVNELVDKVNWLEQEQRRRPFG